MSRNKVIETIVIVIIAIGNGALSLCLCADKSCPYEYHTLYVLPLAYIIVLLVFWIIIPMKMLNNLGVIVFAIQSVIRCSVIPMFMLVGNYKTLFVNVSSEFVSWAIVLLLYEQFCCVCAIRAYSRIKKSYSIGNENNHLSYSNRNATMIVIIIALICLVLWLLVPQIRANYSSIFNILLSTNKFVGSEYANAMNGGGIIGILTTLFIVLFKSVRIVVPVYLIRRIRNKNTIGSLIIAFAIIFLQFLFIPATIAECLISATLLLIIVYRHYVKFRKAIVFVLALVSMVFVIAILSLSYEMSKLWYGVDNIAEYICQTLQSYFTGVSNIASIFRLPEENGLSVFVHTFVSAIPFQSTIFGDWASSYNLNVLYTSTPGLGGQIVATIAGGYYMLGAILSPVFSIIFISISMKYGELYSMTRDDWKSAAYLFMCIQFAIGLGVYNIPITLAYWMQAGIPLLLIAKFSNTHAKRYRS